MAYITWGLNTIGSTAICRTEEDDSCTEEDETAADEEGSCADEDETGADEERACIDEDGAIVDEEDSCIDEDETTADKEDSCIDEDETVVGKEDPCTDEDSIGVVADVFVEDDESEAPPQPQRFKILAAKSNGLVGFNSEYLYINKLPCLYLFSMLEQ